MKYDPIPSYELAELLILGAKSGTGNLSVVEEETLQGEKEGGQLLFIKNSSSKAFYVAYLTPGDRKGYAFVSRRDTEGEARFAFEREKRQLKSKKC